MSEKFEYKISIIIPVKNSESTISRCIDSGLNQTLKDVELVCIDDGSTDNSAQLLTEYRNKFDNIKLITYENSQTAMIARKDGIEMSSGKYIMFMDSDDFILPNTCSDLYSKMEKHNVDILHFNSNIINVSSTENRVKNMEKFVKPYFGKLKDEEVFNECFMKHKYNFNLWNKIFDSRLCKGVLQHIPNGFYPKANDLMLYFVLSYYAKSYLGIDTPQYYNYFFGNGSTGKDKITLTDFKRITSSASVYFQIEKFCEERNESYKYKELIDRIKESLINDSLRCWSEDLVTNEKPMGFDLLIESFGSVNVVSSLAKRYKKNTRFIAENVLNANSLKANKRKIETIGLFYHRMAKGGVQKVIALLIPLYLKQGYKVVLFTDEIDFRDEYPISKEVKRVLLPNSLKIKAEEYTDRAEALCREIKINNIDIMIYHAAVSELMFYDLLQTKSLGVPFVIQNHDLYSKNMITPSAVVADRHHLYRIADKLIVLSRVEELYWRSLNVDVLYIQNPIENIKHTKGLESNYVLWIGRFEARQKQYMDAVKIFHRVVSKIPNAKLVMVGHEVTSNAVMHVKKYIADNNLTANIEIHNFSKNVDNYYQHAKIHLLTSAYEAFPMTIIESKQHHLPLVTYDMPYLELLRDGLGHISVPQGDINAAADAIIDIYNSDDLCAQLGDEANISIQKFKDFDLGKRWKTLISEIESSQVQVQDSQEYNENQIMLDTLLFHYQKGCLESWNRLSLAKKQLPKTNIRDTSYEQLNAILSSTTYKVGRFIMAVPCALKAYLIRKRKKVHM